LPNQPYVPCCYRNDDCTARVGRGGEKSTAADQAIANTGTEPRENVMGTMMGRCGGRQGCHPRRHGQPNRHCKSFHVKSPCFARSHPRGSTSLVDEGVGDLVAKLPHLSACCHGAVWREIPAGSPPWLLGQYRGRGYIGRALAQQSHEPDKQRATEDHRPVPAVETEQPAVGRYEFELHGRPLPNQPAAESSQCASGLVYYRLREMTDNCQN
jgi:hypothetical protein